MRRTSWLAAAAAVALLSCGEVPTLEQGIAYYTPVLLPLPAVAAGDTLRDSEGHAARLRVRAFGRDSQEITGLEVTFVPTTLPADVTIDTAGFLVARDTLRSVQIVGQIEHRLQTSAATLQIVPEPSAIGRGDDGTADSAYAVPAIKALPVVVTGVYRGVTTPVNGIIVRFHIDSVQPAGLPPGSAILALTTGGGVLRPDSLSAVDTTKSAGNASRSVLVPAGSAVKRVFISASANRLRTGQPLEGSPLRFTLELKP